MNFCTLLSEYQPVERSNFMLRYKICNRNYVLFSPVKNFVTCIELFDFTEISPEQLALLLPSCLSKEKELDEFQFQVICSKEQIISYLFNIENSEVTPKNIHISGQRGYLMYDLIKKEKVRNLFQFDYDKGISRLLFDNKVCIASLREEYQSNVIHLCWDPCIFYSIEKGGEQNVPAYLLASALPLVNGYVMKQIEKRMVPKDENCFVGIHVGHNVYEALSFVCYYTRQIQTNNCVIPFQFEGMMYMEMVQWDPIVLSKFVACLNKLVLLRISKEITECIDVVNPFTCVSFNRRSFICFPYVLTYLEFFLKQYVEKVNLTEICLLNIDKR